MKEKKYYLVKYAWDTGTDDGMDCDTKKEAQAWARRYLKDGWETVACINRHEMRVEEVYGQPQDVFSWFVEWYKRELRSNTTCPTILRKCLVVVV